MAAADILSGRAVASCNGPAGSTPGDHRVGKGDGSRSRFAPLTATRLKLRQFQMIGSDLVVEKITRAIASAATAPANCAKMNSGTSIGRIPENVLVSDRAIVIAG